jgi:hypothetical protein
VNEQIAQINEMLQLGFGAVAVLVLIGGLAVGVAIIVYLVRGGPGGRLRRMLLPAQRALGGQLDTSFARGMSLTTSFADREARVAVRSAGSEQRPRDLLEIELRAPFDFELIITETHFVGRLLELAGIWRDLEIGDPGFDSRYQVRGSAPERAVAFLQDPERRALIGSLLEDGLQWFEVRPEGLCLSATVPASQPVSIDLVHRALQGLAEILDTGAGSPR